MIKSAVPKLFVVLGLLAFCGTTQADSFTASTSGGSSNFTGIDVYYLNTRTSSTHSV